MVKIAKLAAYHVFDPPQEVRDGPQPRKISACIREPVLRKVQKVIQPFKIVPNEPQSLRHHKKIVRGHIAGIWFQRHEG